MKQIDLLQIERGICPNCFELEYYSVDGIVREWKCGKDTFSPFPISRADEPCSLLDWKHCPVNEERE